MTMEELIERGRELAQLKRRRDAAEVEYERVAAPMRDSGDWNSHLDSLSEYADNTYGAFDLAVSRFIDDVIALSGEISEEDLNWLEE